MKKSAHQSPQASWWTSRGLLITEQVDEYEALHDAFIEDCNPRDIIQRTFVTDVADLTWEILRYRRLKAHVMSVAYQEELSRIAVNMFLDMNEKRPDNERMSAEELTQSMNDAACQWNAGEDVPNEVGEIMREIESKGPAIEFTAFKNSRSFIDAIDRSLATLEIRRLNAVRFLMEYNKAPFARKVDKISTRLIESEAPPLQPATRQR
jgi:hypothetical protein